MKERENIKNLLIKYEIFNENDKIHHRTITTYIKRAEKENLSIEEYLKQIYQKKKDRENIMIKFGLNPKEFPRKLTAARNAGYRTENEIEDVRNLLNAHNQAKLEKEDLQRKRDEFMIQNGLKPENWTNNLVTARANGFKSDDPFKDLEKYLLYSRRLNLIKTLIRIKTNKISIECYIPYERVGNTLDFAHKHEYNSGNDIKDIKNYQKFLKEKDNKNSIIGNKINDLCNKYNIKRNSYKYYIIAAHKNGFKSNNNLKDFENYMNFKLKELKINNEKEIIINKISNDFKIPKNQVNYYIYYAKKIGFDSNNLYLNIKNYFEYIELCNKEKEEKRKIYNKIAKEFNINYNLVKTYISNAHQNNFINGKDEYENVKNYLNYINNKKNIELTEKHKFEEDIINLGISLNSYPSILGHARKNGFNTGNNINDIKNYLLYKQNLYYDNNKENNNLKYLSKKFNISRNHIRLYIKKAYKIGYKSDNIEENLINYFKNAKDKEIERNEISKLLKENGLSSTLVNYYIKLAISLGFNDNNNVKNIKNYLKYKNFINEENMQIINLLKHFGIICNKKDIRIYLGQTNRHDFKNKDSRIENLKDYLIYCKKKNIRLEINKSKNRKIAKELNLNIQYINYYINSAHRNGFDKNNNELENLKEYLNYVESIMQNGKNSIYYKTKVSNWIKNNPDEVDFLVKNTIVFKDLIESNNKISGVYCWYINNIPYYIGESNNILSRSYDHLYNIQNFPEYWLNIKDLINKNHNNKENCNFTLSVKVLCECDKEKCKEIEKYFIKKLKPLSQKCNNTDHIIPFIERKYNQYNFENVYYTRLNNVI